MAGILDFLNFGNDQAGGGLLGAINNPLTLAGLGVLSGNNAQQGFSQGLQGFQYGAKNLQEQQKQQQIRQALQQYAQGGNINPLLLSGDPQLMQTALQLQAQQRQAERDKVTDERADRQLNATQAYQNRSLGLQERAANRADPMQRAQNAEQFGIQKGTPEWKAYVLNGELPTSNANVDAQVNQRRQAAEQIGLKPDNPAYNGYILTGKMPREDAQPLTATDKKAVLEADEMVQSTQSAIDNLRQAKVISKQAFSGLGAAQRGYAASFLGEGSDIGKSGLATTDLNNLVTTNSLSQLKAIFGGNPTEGERAILMEIQGSANLPDASRQKIYDRAIALAQRRLQFNKERADQLRGNTYYKPQGQTGPTGPTRDITANAGAVGNGVVDWKTYFGGQ